MRFVASCSRHHPRSSALPPAPWISLKIALVVVSRFSQFDIIIYEIMINFLLG